MHLIGLDIGTTSCKAIVFDADGRMRGQACREYGMLCDASAKAEQDAEAVWSLTREALGEAVTQSRAKDVAALSVSAQGDAIIPVDADFRALHPAILGMDYRSEPHARRCEERLDGFTVFRRTGMRPHPMNSFCKVLLLRELSPKTFDSAARIVTYADFILGKLGGEAMIDHTMASRTMAFDSHAMAWDGLVHQAFGVNPAIWSQPVPSGTVAGKLRPALAEDLGLTRDLLLITGGHDQTCAAIGAGAIREGLGIISTGTAEVLATALPRPVLSKLMYDSYYPCYLHARPGMHFTFSLNHIGGILLKWWRDNLAAAETADAAARGTEPYALIDERMPDGLAPVLFLPHLNGSGTPLCDLQSKGAIVGLTMGTTRHDIAKAILKGLCFELRTNVQTLTNCGIAINELVAVGGGAKSERWLQLKADILNRPLRVLSCREAACLGAALLAGTAAGAWSTLEEAVAQTVKYAREFVPAPGRAADYAERFSVYQQLHPALQTLNPRL